MILYYRSAESGHHFVIRTYVDIAIPTLCCTKGWFMVMVVHSVVVVDIARGDSQGYYSALHED